jgi:hypothetical protein
LGTGKPPNGLSLVPAQAAAENAAAAAQPDGHKVVLGRGKPRTGEPHQNAAVFNPASKSIMRVADIADIGKHQHRQILVKKMRHGISRRFPLRQAHIGKWLERALQVITR